MVGIPEVMSISDGCKLRMEAICIGEKGLAHACGLTIALTCLIVEEQLSRRFYLHATRAWLLRYIIRSP
jgi:hypothetical protein